MVNKTVVFWMCKLIDNGTRESSMARDDSPASSTAAAAARRPMHRKVGSELET